MSNIQGKIGLLGTIFLTTVSFPSCSDKNSGLGLAAGGASAAGGGNGTGVTCGNFWASTSGASLWEQLNNAGSVPQVRYGTASVYDASRDALVVFGGTDKTTFYNDVRVLANASNSGGTPTWTVLQTSGTAPSPRSFAIAGYNAAQDDVFIFGGVDGNNKLQVDLWKLANASGTNGTPTWSNVPISGQALSPIRGEMSGIYDEKTDTLVFFGGISCTASLCTEFNDTYALKGLAGQPYWQLVTSSGGAPPGRYFHTSIYDLGTGSMVIFGGNTATNPSGDATANVNDVWVLAGATSANAAWHQVTANSSVSPPALMGHSAVYDQNNGRMVIYGGVNTSNTVTTSTWVLAGLKSPTQKWFEYDTGTLEPKSRTMHAAAYTGSPTNRMIVFGGNEGGGNYANDTWVLHNANGLSTTPIAKITIASASTTVCASNWVKLTATADDANGNEIVGVVFVWTSSDESVATVDGEGLVTAIASGTVTITVTNESGAVTASVTLTVTPSTSTPPINGVSDSGTSNCTCYCGWPANQVCTTNTDCPPDTSVPGTDVPGVCGCPVGC